MGEKNICRYLRKLSQWLLLSVEFRAIFFQIEILHCFFQYVAVFKTPASIKTPSSFKRLPLLKRLFLLKRLLPKHSPLFRHDFVFLNSTGYAFDSCADAVAKKPLGLDTNQDPYGLDPAHEFNIRFEDEVIQIRCHQMTGWIIIPLRAIENNLIAYKRHLCEKI